MSSSFETRTADEVLAALDSTPDGLTEAEAARRLEQYGLNELPAQEPQSLFVIFLRQFISPLIYVLVAAAVVSLLAGEVVDAVFIGIVLLVNAVIGTVSEARAERGMKALQTMLKAQAIVERAGHVQTIDAAGVVPGDVVWLESGLRVPADLRLLHANGLEIDESMLTGESVAVEKDARWKAEEPTSVGDRLNMAHAGSMVVRGRASGVVVATGLASEIGAIASSVLEAEGARPPLVVRMEAFVRLVAIAILVLVLITAAIGLLRGYSLFEMFFLAVALAVSAIPEGLPVGITVVLSLATVRMVRRNVVTRHLPVVEGLGSCTLIVSDKTGTLTVNALTARELRLADGRRIEVSGQGFEPEGALTVEGRPLRAGDDPAVDRFVAAGVLNNEANLRLVDGEWEWAGDPTDVALLALGVKLGLPREVALERSPVTASIPFEAEHRYSATFHHDGDGEAAATRVQIKGAPEEILAMCAGSEAEHEAWGQTAEEMAANGYRVLAIASHRLEVAADGIEEPPPLHQIDEPLEFLGFVGMIDPLRPEVKGAIEAAHRAGVDVFMVTGDHPTTALAIARELGIAEHESDVVTGKELEQAYDEELDRLVRTHHVFARMAPEQKLRIVHAAQHAGHFVAVTGDGVNDAPALRAANIGVAMGKGGTDVARESSDVVISDDNFASIVGGIEEGRIAYDNIRKVIFLLLSTGAAEIVLLMVGIIAGLPLPLTAVQLLWLNVATNGIQHLALGTDPAEGDVLDRPPRDPDERIFNRLMIERIVLTAVTLGLIGSGLFAWLLSQGWSEFAARNALLLFMVLFENVHVFSSRSEKRAIWQRSLRGAGLIVAGVLAAQGLHLIAMYVGPVQNVLQTGPVSLKTWALLLVCTLPVVVVLEVHKAWHRRRERESAPPSHAVAQRRRRGGGHASASEA